MAEQLVKANCLGRGLKFISENTKIAGVEIDLIFSQDKPFYLVHFFEVKTDSFLFRDERVSERQLSRLRQARWNYEVILQKQNKQVQVQLWVALVQGDNKIDYVQIDC